MNDMNKETQRIIHRFLPTKNVSLSDELSSALSGFQAAKDKMLAISGKCDMQATDAEMDKEIAQAEYNIAIESAQTKQAEAEDTKTSIEKSIKAINTILGID